jgi:leucyl-tRNA synthetase
VDKFLPTEDGEPPLARATDWKYKGQYDYESTTMPGWAGSSWYFLRYMDAQNNSAFADQDKLNYWQSVDLYIGGSEHATGHLLYVRFWTKFLKDLGFIAVDEPAKKLINQGMIQGTSAMVHRVNGEDKIVSAGLKNNYATTAIHIDVNYVENNVVNIEALREWRDDFKNTEFELEEGKLIASSAVEKMSKRWYNVVTPDSICERFGADTLRLYEMFLGPLEQSKPWNTNGITGVSGFLKKLWRLFYSKEGFSLSEEVPTKAELKTLHKTIKKITEDLERFSFNTSVSSFMICVNELGDHKCNKRQILEPLLILLSPYAPHIAEELWQHCGHEDSIAFAPFPVVEEQYLIEDNFNYPVSFNGKMKYTLELPMNLSIQQIEEQVMANADVISHLQGTVPKKIIIVPKKIVNIVV